jgi:hypothetical protein
MAANTKAKWMKKLTPAERAHMRMIGCHSLQQARETFAQQAAQRRENEKRHVDQHTLIEPCWECKHIARKLGFPV